VFIRELPLFAMDSQGKVSSIAVGAVAMVATVAVCVLLQQRKVKSLTATSEQGVPAQSAAVNGKILILYGTTTGTAKSFALKLQSKLLIVGREVQVCNLAEYDQEKLVKENIVLYICSTWEGGVAPESCQPFLIDLKDYAHDFRVSKDLLEKVKFAVFGLGGELYSSNFGKAVSGSLSSQITYYDQHDNVLLSFVR
jgi:sulfite reductase alpha subunit-like flavoprotein